MEASITRRNIRRLFYILIGIIAIQILFLVYVERIRLLENAHDLVWVSYLLHSILTFYALGTWVFIFFTKNKGWEEKPAYQRLPLLTVFMILLIAAIISLFDQVTHGHVTIFTAYLLSFGLLIYIRYPFNVFIYTIPFGFFLVGVLVFQDNRDILLTHSIHGGIIYAGVLFTSTMFYRNYRFEFKISEALMEKNQQLEILATVDPLTTLYNRRHFEQQVRYEASINRRYQHEASLLLIDIDHFKEVNDTYGHQAGDMILVQIAEILKDSVRESDTVCRFGGEEFMILASHTDIDGAMVLARRLNSRVQASPFQYGKMAIEITVSIGVTKLDHQDFEVSYGLVDAALYEAKNQGRNRVIKKL